MLWSEASLVILFVGSAPPRRIVSLESESGEEARRNEARPGAKRDMGGEEGLGGAVRSDAFGSMDEYKQGS